MAKSKTLEHRAKISKAMTGRKLSDETKRRMSVAAKKRRATPQARKNMSVAQKLRRKRARFRAMSRHIFRVTNKVTGKSFIGITVNPPKSGDYVRHMMRTRGCGRSRRRCSAPAR